MSKPQPFSNGRYRFARRMSKIRVSAVREILKISEQPDVISFAGGLPAPELFPIGAIAEAHRQVFTEEGAAALQYSTTEGWLPLREWIAQRLVVGGVETTADRVLITSGSQQGIDLVAKVFLDAGDQVIVENPCYLAALQSFSGFEASFIAIDSDDHGMRVEQVESALQRSTAKLIYVVSDFHNPKGTSLAPDRREQLIHLSRHYRVPILEDDPYGELRYSGTRPPALAALDRDGLVIYLSTFSKTLSPGMRLGWVSASNEIIHALIVAKQATDLHTCTVEQRAAGRLLSTFDYDGHIAQLRSVYGMRCNAMLAALERHFPSTAQWTHPEGGLFIWAELPRTVRAETVLEEAIKQRVAFVPGAPFFAQGEHHNFMRLNFSNRPAEAIEEGISRIGRILKGRRMK
jgi:2-aminoadipate transaminase